MSGLLLCRRGRLSALIARAITVAGTAFVAAMPSSASVTLFVDDAIGFGAQIGGHTLLGSEDWSDSSIPVGGAPVAEPLLPGVATAEFPNGVNAATGMTVQSNTLGENAATPMVGVGLFVAPPGFRGGSGNLQASEQLSTEDQQLSGASLDLIFARVGNQYPVAVSLSPMFYQIIGPSSGDVSIAVFNPSEVLLASATVPNVADVSEASFFGVIAENGDKLGRINLWVGDQSVPGADNIDVYAVPEVGAGVAAFVSLSTLVTARRRVALSSRAG